jgi:hypothetical protein
MDIKRPVLFPDEHSDEKKDKKKSKIKKHVLFVVNGEKKNNKNKK